MVLRLLLEQQAQVREGEVVAPKGSGRWMVRIGKNLVSVQSEGDLSPGQKVLVAKVGSTFHVVRRSGQARTAKRRVYIKG